MIHFSDIEKSLSRRLARRITVEPTASGEPFLARLYLAENAHKVQPGHVWLLAAEGETPAIAVDELLEMLDLWLVDPLGPHLTDTETMEGMRRVFRRLVPTSESSTHAATTPRSR
ncbi:MAG: hypothetical protein ACHREM_06390 [Polyangiales bacterium]